MPMRLDDEGYLLTEDGQRFLQNGEPVKVDGAFSQEQLNKTIGERLKQEREKLTKRISALEELEKRTPAIEAELEAAKADKAALETQLKDAEKAAGDKVSSQLAKLTKERDEYQTALQREQQARVSEQVTNAILAKAGDRFVNPAGDLVPRLLGAHKREPAKDKDGKTIEGQFVDLFKTRFKDEKGNEVEDFLPVDRAVEAFATDPANAHYVRPAGRGGSGGGIYNSGGKEQKGGFTYETMK